jgi:hypothetical protein
MLYTYNMSSADKTSKGAERRFPREVPFLAELGTSRVILF